MTGSGKSPSILLLGNYRPSLTLARTFARLGFRSVVGSHGCERTCQHSSAVDAVWNHAPLETSPERFAAELRAYCSNKPDLKAIFPVAEEYVRLFADHPAAFGELPPIATMAPDLVKSCLDKPFMMKLATDNGVPTAPYAVSTAPDQFRSALASVGLPAIVRPLISTDRLDDKKALALGPDDPQPDAKHLARPLLIQRKFEGIRHNYYFAAVEGTLVRGLHAIIDRTDNPDRTGLAVRGRTLPPNGDMAQQTTRLVKALSYTGVGCAQFLVDEETGETSFLEINPRIAGNHALPEYCGLALGEFMLNLATGTPNSLDPVWGREGIRYSWFTGDLMGAKVAYLRGELSAGAAVAQCLSAVCYALRADVDMVFSLSDPGPGLSALRQVLPRLDRWNKPAVSPGTNTIMSHKEEAST